MDLWTYVGPWCLALSTPLRCTRHSDEPQHAPTMFGTPSHMLGTASATVSPPRDRMHTGGDVVVTPVVLPFMHG